MPKTTTTAAAKGGILAKLGPKLKKAHEAHKDDEVTLSAGGDPPAGLEGAIAKLKEIRFGTYKDGVNKGQPYFYAAGIIVSPKEVEVDAKGFVNPGRLMKIEGLRTSVIEPVCDTPKAGGKRKTLDEHWAWVLNELRKLSPETDWGEVDPDEMEAAVAALAEDDLYFTFRTWKGEPATEGQYKGKASRLQHDWRGATQYTPEEEATDDVVDNSEATAEETATEEVANEMVEETTEEVVEEQVDEDLDDLAKKADAKPSDAEAADRLSELAQAAGVGKQADKAANWKAVVKLIRAATPVEETAEGEEVVEEQVEEQVEEVVEEATGYTVGECVFYKPIGKDKKPAKKALEYEITAIDTENEKLTIRLLADKKTTYKGVPFSKIVTE